MNCVRYSLASVKFYMLYFEYYRIYEVSILVIM